MPDLNENRTASVHSAQRRRVPVAGAVIVSLALFLAALMRARCGALSETAP